MELQWTGAEVDELLFSRRENDVGPMTVEPPPAPEGVSLDRRDLDAFRAHLDVVFEHIATALAQADARVAGMQERLVSRLDAVEAAVAEAAPAERNEPVDLVRVERHLNERLTGMAEQASRDADARNERLLTLEEQMQQVLARVDAVVESRRRDLDDAPTATASATGPTTADDSARLDALEAEMAELVEYHAALDAGLGTLRSEIAQLLDLTATIAGGQADLTDRMEASSPVGPADQAPRDRSRKPGRRGEATAQLADQVALLTATTGRLAGEQRDLKADVARLAQDLRAAALSANRSTELSALGPLRSEMNLLGEQLAEQHEALEALHKAVDRLRRKAPAPAAKRGAPPAGT